MTWLLLPGDLAKDVGRFRCDVMIPGGLEIEAGTVTRLQTAYCIRAGGTGTPTYACCAKSRQVHVYRQPVEEVNHSGSANSAFEGKSSGVECSAFEGKSLGVELACMLGLGDPRWRHWCLHRVILAVVGQTLYNS